MHRLIISLCLLLFAFSFNYAQHIVPKAIAYSVEQMELDYLAPVENPFKVKRGIQSDYFSYNALYRNKKEKLEIFVILEEENSPDDLVAVPHVEFSRIITALANNSLDFNIIVKFMRDDKLRKYNADWGAETELILKNGISMNDKAKLVSFYKEVEEW